MECVCGWIFIWQFWIKWSKNIFVILDLVSCCLQQKPQLAWDEMKDPVLASRNEFFRLQEKFSSLFNSKMSKNGKEWRLDNGIEQSSWDFEPPSKTRANNLDQETSAEFEGFWAAKNSSFWNLGHKQSRTGREITAQFIMGRSHRLSGHKTRMKFEHCGWIPNGYTKVYTPCVNTTWHHLSNSEFEYLCYFYKNVHIY